MLIKNLFQRINKFQMGLSIIELIIAMALFMIVAGGLVITVLSSFSSTRLAKEELVASSLAEEGLEAVESTRNQSWVNLAPGIYGLSNSGGIWIFSGSSDVDVSGKYTRTVTISAVQRDANGEIVSTGGTVDGSSYLVEVAVSWDFTPTRNNSVQLSQYFTDWQLAVGAGTAGSGPGVTTCAQYCQNNGYTTGTCRQNAQQCSVLGETYEAAGDTYCTGGASADTCCCAP